MRQLGNLAMVCAQRSDVLLQIQDGNISLYVGNGSQGEWVMLNWEDDEGIMEVIRELNFGRYHKEGKTDD